MSIFRKKAVMCIIALGMLVLSGAGCGKDQEKKIRDLEFTVVDEEKLPEELRSIIEGKKEGEFRLTYTDGGDMYIAAGYGRQLTGGYSIKIPQLYLTEKNIVFESVLMGPEKKEPANVTYPYAVIKLEAREEPVIFR